MVTIQDTELKEGIREGIQKARHTARPVLVSEVQIVHTLDPIAFFQAGQDHPNGERFFWKDPTDELFVVGVGTAKTIETDRLEDRFFHVENKWKKLLCGATIIDNGVKEQATGPMLFGGFSFDPLKPKTDLWKKFGDTLFHLPVFQLTVKQGKYYITTNVVCTGVENDEWIETISERRQQLISTQPIRESRVIPTHVTTKEMKVDEWRTSVASLVDILKTSSTLQKAVLARELRLHFTDEIPIQSVITNLLRDQHESYLFAFESRGDCFVGASPERLVKKSDDQLFSTCLAGSIARGQSFEEDEELGQALLNDPKNLHEHQIVVDMIKDAMNQVCHEVNLPSTPQLLKNKHIQHLYTPVVGRGSIHTSILQLVELLHPTPALGGFPKQEAVEVIRQIEELDRGMYAAPIGWLDHYGNGEFAVAIRSGLIQHKEASLFAGCGIVEDSIVESEYMETKIKFRPMLSALKGEMK